MSRGTSGHWQGVPPAGAQADAHDARGVEDLYRRYHDRVWRTLGCLGVPDAALDDAVQDVFVIVCKRLGDPDQYDSIKSWIYAIARRVAWHHHRTRARRQRKLEAVEREPPRGEAPSPEERVAQAEAIVVMRRFLERLDESQRVVFVLAEIEGLTAPEIAQIVSANVNTVHSRLRLARRRFDRIAQAHYKRRQREERGV